MIALYGEGQLTDWLWTVEGHQPARRGVYQVEFSIGATRFAQWDGFGWSIGYMCAESAQKGMRRAAGRVLRWRGLSFDPALQTKTALQQFAESIEFSGPDGDGLFWLHASAPGGLKMAVNLGPERGVVARAAAQLEQLRVKALMECKR